MKLDREIVLHVAKLARLELTESEVDLFTTQLSTIVDYVEKLKEIDNPVEPFSFSSFLALPMRHDTVLPSLPVEQSLKNAPDRKKNFFRVPRIIP